MRYFFSALYKDIKLFLSAAGIFAVILPILLLPALSLGFESGSGTFLDSFPIAVRDEDGTVMSRALITQLQDIELFSEVRVLTEGETDEEALRDGAVAVATIPKDFFYKVYRMDDCPVEVTVNTGMTPECTVFQSVFTSIMGIIRANHASALGTYTFVYGDLTQELIKEMRAETGDRLVLDALGRQRVFTNLMEEADLPAALTRRLAACVLGVLAIFFALSSAKTLPEERRLGVLPRLRAMGRRSGPFILSKFLASLVPALPALALTAALTGMSFWYITFIYILLLFAAFGCMTAVSALAGSAASAQRAGSVILLLSLALSGTLWPVASLPEALRPVSMLTLPHYALLALEARNAGIDMAPLPAMLWPLGCIGLAGFTVTAISPYIRRPAGTGGKRGLPGAAPQGEDKSPRRKTAGRILGIGLIRWKLVTGGAWALAVTLAAAAVCGVCAGGISSAQASSLRLAVCDRDGTEYSRALAARLEDAEGVELEAVELEEGRTQLLTGEREGLIIIGRGYSKALREGTDTPLSFESSAASVTAQAAREIVAGEVIGQIRSLEARGEASRLLGRELSYREGLELQEAIDKAAGELGEMYIIRHTAGAAPADPFAPGAMSFACLAALFILLTAAGRLSGPDARAAERRLASLPQGGVMGMTADMAALTALGAAVMLAATVPAGLGLWDIPAALAGSVCMSALALALSSFTAAEGRVDTLAPLTALFICVLGGCFIDLDVMPKVLRSAALLSPAALTVRAAERSLSAYCILGAETAVFCLAKKAAALFGRGRGPIRARP